MKISLLVTAILVLTNQSVWAQTTFASSMKVNPEQTASSPAINSSIEQQGAKPAAEQLLQTQPDLHSAATSDVTSGLESRLEQRLATEIRPDTVPHKGFASAY